MILNGYRMYAFGGSDAHGDLNLHRSVGLPFFSVKEGLHHTFGSVRTIVRAKSKEKEDILEGLKAGRAVVTEGPFIDLTVTSGYSVVGPGEVAPRGSLTVRTIFLSSPEFGKLKTGRIIAGVEGEKTERIVGNIDRIQSDFDYCFEEVYNMERIFYIRAECETESGKLCFTNPVWIE